MSRKKASSIGLPQSSSTCRVSIINATCDITAPVSYLVEPELPGQEWLNMPTYSFHIKHDKTGEELLFDLGCRKDWWNSVPHITDLLSNHVPGLRVKEDVVDILIAGKVDLNNIQAFILSHWHFDHCGDPAVLPKSIDLLVGPGFKKDFVPGYPAKETSTFHESAFEGRQVVEVPFTEDFKIGKFQAYDYFGDGSLYILNVPGHAVGHISALVRTTPDTAVFLGGDVCHFTGALRPTAFISMPDNIPEETPLDRRIARPCPCIAFTQSHPDQEHSRTTPFYRVSTGASSFYVDPPTAQRSIAALAEFDADPKILILIAHDPTSLDVLPFFPDGTVNDWHERGWKQALHWGFVNELPYNGKTSVREPLVDGLYREGKRVKDLQGKAV